MSPETTVPRGQPDGRDKSRIRQETLRARARLDASVRRRADVRIRDHLLHLPALSAARTVAGYAARGPEVDLDPWLRVRIADGSGVFLPRVAGRELELYRVTDLDAELEVGYRGVREPRPGGRRPALVARIEAFVVPGVAFDPTGTRLGHGGGHFDRLLAARAAGATVIGVAYAVQVCPALPRRSHDVPVDVVVTEDGALHPADRGPDTGGLPQHGHAR